MHGRAVLRCLLARRWRLARMHPLCRLAALVCLASLSPAAVVAAGPAAKTPKTSSLLPVSRPVVLPCGIADPAGRTGFFASAAGGLEAIDLKTGEVLWETAEAQRPLLVWGTRLLAQAGVQRNRLRVLVFDLADNGHCVLESDPVVLPEWVVTADAPGRSFDAHWKLDGNQLVLAWEATAWYAAVARPTSQQQVAARKHAMGMARIDLDTGRVEQGPAERAAAEPPAGPLQALEKKSVRWQGRVGSRHCAAILEDRDGQQTLVLRSWDQATGREAQPRELLRGKRLLLQATLDGSFFLLRDAGSAPDEKGLGKDRTDQHWTLISPELGGEVGRLPYEPGTQAVAVLGRRAYYCVAGPVRGHIDRPLVQPRTLKAYDLTAGKTVWERPVAARLLAPPVR
jgi:hypothetical protein